MVVVKGSMKTITRVHSIQDPTDELVNQWILDNLDNTPGGSQEVTNQVTEIRYNEARSWCTIVWQHFIINTDYTPESEQHFPIAPEGSPEP